MTDTKDECNKHNQKQKCQRWGLKFFRQKSGRKKVEESKLEDGCFRECKSFPLTMARVGEYLAIAKLKGTDSTVHRLISMGLVPGTKFQIINIVNGSIIVGVGDSRIGLGTGLARKIMCTNV